jgi:hypothetical protein
MIDLESRRALRERKQAGSLVSLPHRGSATKESAAAPLFTGARAWKAQVVIYLRYMNSAVRTQYTSNEVCRPLPALFLYGRRSERCIYHLNLCLRRHFISPIVARRSTRLAACALFPSPIYPSSVPPAPKYHCSAHHVKLARFRRE